MKEFTNFLGILLAVAILLLVSGNIIVISAITEDNTIPQVSVAVVEEVEETPSPNRERPGPSSETETAVQVPEVEDIGKVITGSSSEEEPEIVMVSFGRLEGKTFKIEEVEYEKLKESVSKSKTCLDTASCVELGKEFDDSFAFLNQPRHISMEDYLKLCDKWRHKICHKGTINTIAARAAHDACNIKGALSVASPAYECYLSVRDPLAADLFSRT